MNIREIIALIERAGIEEASRYATPTPGPVAALGKTPVERYLYHGTPLDCLLNIIKNNEIATGIDWRGEGDRVALTRSYDVAKKFGQSSGGSYWGYNAILVLDWAKLAKDYEIHPYRDTDHAGVAWETDEEEEAVYGVIRPLTKYLVSMNVDPAHLATAMTDEEWIAMCVEEKDFFKSPRGLINALKKLPTLSIFNKTK